ncbi:MAG: cupin domain-containing protein [Myxococcota bacterium]
MIAEEELLDLALGTLAPQAQAEALRAVAQDPRLRQALFELEETLGKIGQSLPPRTPSPGAKERLLKAVAGPERFAPFLSKLSGLLDLGVDRVRAILAEAEDRTRWVAGPIPGLQLFHFQAGPAVVGDAGLVRLPAGFTFPEHRHLGREISFLLEGSYTETGTGVIVRAGDVAIKEPGSAHGFTVGPDIPIVYALLISDGVEIGGQVFRG